MRQLSNNFIQANSTLSRNPTLVIKIINENKNIYLTHGTVDITDAGADFLQNSIISCGGASQTIVPERGYSTIGNIKFSFLDLGFTEILRGLKNSYNDSINNNKVEIYTGFADLAFADYALVIPMYVSQVDNNESSFTVSLSDTQRFVKKSIFSDLKKTTAITSLGVLEGSIEVISSDGFEAVYHDSGWGDAPGRTVGYLSVSGTDPSGSDITEIMRWEGKADSTHFTIVERGVAGTRIVDIEGTVDGGNYELEEIVYLDLPVPKMVIALQTGDLYGDVGKTLPYGWHAGMSASLIDIASYENIGSDLSSLRLEFWGVADEDAKGFIAEQCLAPINLFNYINQNGEMALKRFSYLPTNGSGDLILDYESITSVDGISRDTKSIRNVFTINWEWRHQDDSYYRSDTFADGNSIALNNFMSDAYTVNLKGLRNRNRDSGLAVSQLAEGIRARFSAPKVTPTVKAFLSETIQLEIGDIVVLDLPNQPDYASLDTLRASFEVQGLAWDFMTGETTLKLFGSSGIATPLELTSGVDSLTFNRRGWTPLLGSAHGSVSTSGDFEFYDNATLTNGNYYFDGNIIINANFTVYITESVRIDCIDFTILTGGKIDGVGRGVVGAKGIFGGASGSQEGMYSQKNPFQGRYVRRITAGDGYTNVAASNAAGIPVIAPKIEESGDLVGFSGILYGNGGGHGGALDFQIAFSGDPYRDGGSESAGGAGLMILAANLFTYSEGCIDVSGAPSNVGSSYTDNGERFASGSGGFGWPGAVYFLSKDRTAPLPNLNGPGGAVRAFTGAFSEIRVPEYRPFWDVKRSSKNGSREPIGPILPPGHVDGNKQCNGLVSMSVRLSQDKVHVPDTAKDTINTARTPTVTVTELVNTPRTPLGNQSTITITGAPQAGDLSYLYTLFEYRAAGQTQWVSIDYDIRSEATVTVASDGSSYQIQSTAINLSNRRGGSVVSTITVTDVDKNKSLLEAQKDLTVPPIRRLELVNRLNNSTDWDKFKSSDAEFKWAKTSVTNGGDIVNSSGATDLHLTGYKVRVFRVTGGILREEIVTDSYYTYTLEKNKKDTNGSPVREFKIDVQPIATTGFIVKPTEISVSNPAPDAVLNPVAVQTFSGIDITYDLPSDVDFVGVKIRGKVYSGSSVTISPSVERFEVLDLVSVDQFGEGGNTTVNAYNPQPAPPTSLTPRWGITSAKVSFVKAIDVDFIGTAYRYGVKAEDGSVVYNDYFEADSNEIVLEGLNSGTQYEVEFKSIDLLGPSDAVSVVFTTETLIASDVEGLGNWATAVDLVDLEFINANMDSDALPSTKIASLTASKITAGTLAATEYIQVGNVTDGGVLLTAGNGVDEGGYIQTIAPTVEGTSNYLITVGPHVDPSDSNTIYSFSASDGLTTPFFVNINGSASFGKLDLSATGAISSDNFSIAADGSAEFTGKVTVEAGSNVAAGADVTQTALNGTTTMGAGTLHLEGSNANIAIGDSTTFGASGIQLQYNEVSGAGKPQMYIGDGANQYVKYTVDGGVEIKGHLAAATGSFSGALDAATGSFAGSLSAATGSFSGSLSAATGSFAGSLSAATGSFSGSLLATEFYTSASGERVEIGANGNNRVDFYNSTNDLEVSLGSGSTGTGVDAYSYSLYAETVYVPGLVPKGSMLITGSNGSILNRYGVLTNTAFGCSRPTTGQFNMGGMHFMGLAGSLSCTAWRNGGNPIIASVVYANPNQQICIIKCVDVVTGAAVDPTHLRVFVY